MKHNFIWAVVAVLVILSMVAAQCGAPPATEAPPAATEEPMAEEPTAEEEPVAEEPATEEPIAEEPAMEGPTGLEFLDRAYAGEFDGTVVTMAGPFTDEDAVKFNESIAEFEAATGIDIQYEGSKEFETSISVRVDAGDPPDIADFPQPGLAGNFAKSGKLVDVSTYMDMDWLKENYKQSWLDMATMTGPSGDIMAGVWQRFNGKSLVWYPKQAWDAAGYEIPTTWDELLALTQQIADDGDTAWCIGIESGTATGWPATDWMEEIMLRTTSLDNYDKWTRGQLKFESPEVKNAAEVMTELWFNPDYVYGGRDAIVTTFFGDSPLPMFDDPPKCWLHKQGNFITSFFPAGVEAGVDYDFFYLPQIDEAYGKPFLVAGDLMSQFNDRPEVRAVMEFFSTGASVKGWLAAGGALSPHNDASLDWYGDDVERGVAELVIAADSVAFDGSDLMPGEVGAGSFWKGMTDYVSGATDLDTTLAEIDAAWPGEVMVEEEAPAEEPSAGMVTGLEFLDRAYAGEFDGTVVTMAGPFTDEDAVKFNESIADFEAATGIDVQYEGSKEFETSISVRVDAGDPPDIADFPQPGLAGNFAKTGKLVDVSTFMDMDWLKENYKQSWLDMATMTGPDGDIMAGVWQRFNGKSLVWYPKQSWEAAGYEIPTTWDELMALTQQIADDGDTAWCIGIESGTATGWPATDWMEEIMLRTTSLDNYDKWTRGELKFESPEVKNAAEVMTELWFNPDYVYGGRDAIVTTFFGDSPLPMFDDPPKCWLHKQGNFITSFFPAGVEAGVDYDFFYLPPIDDAYGKPFLVAGDLMSMFNDRPEVRAVMEFFSTGESVKKWLAAGGALSPHNDASLDWYGDDVERGVAELVIAADSVAFDGSDLMPGEVGAGSFWKGMTDYVSGATDLDTTLAEIDAAWPAGAAPVEEPSAAMETGLEFLDRAYAGEFDGTVVTMAGPFTDEDAVKFNESIADFEAATGIDIQYEGSKEFETSISVRVDAGDPPDIADFPQPGLAGNFAKTGKLVDVSTYMDMDWLKENYKQSWLDMATMAGPSGDIMAGVWQRFNGKSLVWYPKKAWDAAGYEIPTTWDEMMALTQQIADDGDTAWCIGIESGTATGWPATDWMEEIMLRTTSLDNYDKWTKGELKFESPEVKNAAEVMTELWFNPDYVYGGRDAIVTTFFGDSPLPMFDDPPKCWLHKQGNFITSFFPAGVEAGVDYDFFYLPQIDEAYGKPFLVAGDLMSQFNDRPEVRAVMEFFSTGESVKKWLAAGGALSPHNDASLDWYGDDVERGVAELVIAADSVAFDGSDLMPGEVGAGSFWKGMTDYVSGATDLDTTLAEIDSAWPQ